MDLASVRVDVSAETTTAVPTEARYGPVFDAWSGERSSGIRSGGGAISPKSALTLAAYYAAINVLSTDLACLPIKIFRKRKSGGRDEVTNDPRSDLLAVSPDDETTSMRFRQALLGHTFGWGNGYAEIEFSGGQVSGLSLLDPTAEPNRRSQDKRLYYRLPDGSTRPPYKVLHLAGFGYDGLCGYSPARLMAQTITLGKNAETFGSAFFNNGITASGYFESPHKQDKDKSDEFRREINAMHAGASNAHKFMVLWQNMKWTQTTIPPEEAQFLETRQFQVLEIARMFRLPPHKLGDFSQSHLSNIEESNIDYMTTVLMPWCESIEQELNRKLFTREERLQGLYCEHNMDAFLRGNSASRSTFYQTMFGLGQLSINEIRAKENMNPIGKLGDERFLTVQAQPLSTLLNPPAPPAPPPATEPASAADAKPSRVPVPSVNGSRFARTLQAVGSPRENPHHGADGKFSSGGKGKGLKAPSELSDSEFKDLASKVETVHELPAISVGGQTAKITVDTNPFHGVLLDEKKYHVKAKLNGETDHIEGHNNLDRARKKADSLHKHYTKALEADAKSGRALEIPVGLAVNGHVANGARENPHHGPDGKFASGSGAALAGHAPATTATGSKIVVQEDAATSPADKKQLAAAEAKGKTAIHVKDTPDIEVTKSADATVVKVGENTGATVTRTADGKGWAFAEHDYEGKPLGEGHVKVFKSREKAEGRAVADAKKIQAHESQQYRVNTKAPESVIASGKSAKEHEFPEGNKPGWGAKYGMPNAPITDKSTSNWTTTYRVLKKPSEG